MPGEEPRDMFIEPPFDNRIVRQLLLGEALFPALLRTRSF
jgi:hypothetical protein